jgi:multidrug efflux pump
MALFLMFVQGQSINFMILFGLILSVGVLVDSAIVIIEYADRKLAEGMPRKQAFKTAGERMFWPITSSTATTLAAFLPLLFWDDITGKFMSYLPLTMIYVLSASLLMALVFLPTMGALMGPRYVSKPTANLKALSGAEGNPSDLSGFTGLYARIITFLVSKPLLVIIGTVIMLFVITGNFGKAMSGDETAGILPKPVEFFTNTPSDQVFIVARTRGNSTPLSALEISKEIERRIKDIDGVKVVYSVSGAAATRGQVIGASVPTDTVVKVFPELMPYGGRRKATDIMEDMRIAIADMPGILTEVTAESQGPPLGKDLAIELTSDDIDALKTATLMVRAKFES